MQAIAGEQFECGVENRRPFHLGALFALRGLRRRSLDRSGLAHEGNRRPLAREAAAMAGRTWRPAMFRRGIYRFGHTPVVTGCGLVRHEQMNAAKMMRPEHTAARN